MLAESYSTPIGEGIGVSGGNPVPAAHMLVISDGRIADAPELILRRGSMEYIPVGQTADNVGIVNMDVRRSYDRPERVNVVVRVRNFGERAAARELSLYIDDELKEVRSLGSLAPNVATAAVEGDAANGLPPEGSEAVVSFDATHETAGRIEVRLAGGTDALAADDQAFAIVEAPRPVSTLLVTYGNYFLKLALSALPGQKPVILTPDAYEKLPDGDLLVNGRMKYDVVVFDAYSASRLPPGNYLFLGGVPRLEDVKIVGEVENELLVDWDDTHPILRHVVVELIHILRSNKLEMPREAQTLITGGEGPVLSLLARDRRQYLISAFGLFNAERTHLNTNWVLTEGFPAFMYNALHFLAGNVATGGNRSVSPGDAVAISAKPGARSIAVRRPDRSREDIPAGEGAIAYYGNTDRVGLYAAENAADGGGEFAVNLFDDKESMVRPNDRFRIGADRVAATSGEQRVNRPLWPYILAAALAVSFLEWIVYNRRVFV